MSGECILSLKQQAKKLCLELPAIFIALKKKETPIIAKILALLTIGYALSPIDLIPDFIPVLGYLDDVILLPVLITMTIYFIPEEVLAQCRQESKTIWSNGKPKKWYYAVPIILIWLLIFWYIIKLVIA